MRTPRATNIGQPDRSPAGERRQEEEGRQEQPHAIVGRRRQHPDHGQRQEVDEEIERQPVAADLPDRPDQPDHAGDQDRDRDGDRHQDPGIMPGQAVLVDLAEVDDLDVGERVLAVEC